MKRRILLLLFCACPFLLFSQTYKFNRQLVVRYDDKQHSHSSTWTTKIEIEVLKKVVIMRRPSNGAGEKQITDTLRIKDTSKERRDKHDIFTRIKMQDGRILVIYGDDYMTMATKETKEHRRTEYVFYNQKADEQ